MSNVLWNRRDTFALGCAPLLTTMLRAAPGIHAGCQTRCFGMPIREEARFLTVLADIAATGYQGFETNHVNLREHFDRPQRMLDAFGKRHLTLIGLHASPRLQRRDLLVSEVAEGLRVAKSVRALNGSYLVISGGDLPRGSGIRPWAVEVARFGRLCREEGVTLAYHNHSAELENNAEILDALMVEAPPEDVSLLLDVSFFAGTPLRAPDWIARHAKRIVGLHLRTLQGGMESLLHGEPDLAAVAAKLRHLQWSGWAIVELNVRKDMSSREMVAQCRQYMRDRMKI